FFGFLFSTVPLDKDNNEDDRYDLGLTFEF
ncbi:hypothetical protein, partial [uncultured Gammaproteobacteria bacterium]